ncbi:hypothetical protein B0A55_06600 [Friedmanniomyces simplex]|uniref:WW domain-containing protein n=1 Tax=Friedmanniomyces simplex TaxID=329884 RepID=A0A4U0XL22_9PEZI|nr:hypothetical protein B0A55_06600 [Friedmanniomyces simplex]
MTANTYQCTPLRADILEIRLVTLLPDAPGQPLRLKIWHAQPEIPKQRIVHRKTAEELQATLPPGWTTVETNQYQYRFIFEKDDTEDTTWKHPDPAADPCWWQPLPESPPPKYQPTYEALSYVWGPPGEEEKAYIVRSDEEAHLSGKELLVRPNLANALKHFRHAHKPSIFWIDAICIDQTKTKERSLQVMHMAEIYRWAQRVVIWLGKSRSVVITGDIAHPTPPNATGFARTVLYRSRQKSGKLLTIYSIESGGTGCGFGKRYSWLTLVRLSDAETLRCRGNACEKPSYVCGPERHCLFLV